MDTAHWRVEQGPTTYALRVFRAEQLSTYRREMAAMEAAHNAGLAVPAIHAAGIWQERPALLLAWCPGVPLLEAIRREPWRIGPLGMAFGRMQAHIHKTMAPAPLQQDRSGWISWAGPDAPLLQPVLERVASPAAKLLHLDYHPLNVLTDGRRITAILDWANARAGDPRADVARTYSILMVQPDIPGRQSLAVAIARRLLAWTWRRGYEQVAGRLCDMAPFYAWAGSVMVRDLAPRIANPELGWQPRHLEQIQRWARAWQQRAQRL
jgi:aminoglycoside phosphotransferase (APT) family kinase protein